MWKDGRTAEGGAFIIGESQGVGGIGRIVNAATVLSRRMGKVEVPVESRTDVSAHSFWRWGITAMFDIKIFNLDAGSYLRMTSEKAFEK